MYSAAPYGRYAYSDFDFVALDDASFEAWLAQPAAARALLVILDAFSRAPAEFPSGAYADSAYAEVAYAEGSDSLEAVGLAPLRWSTHGFTSKSTDEPASTYFPPRLDGNVEIRRVIEGREGIGGLTSVFAECGLINADGGLDALLRDYAIDGRRVRILLGKPDRPGEPGTSDALADYGVLFTGVAQAMPADERRARLVLSDGSAKLARRIQETVYGGTGGLEGGEDLKGKPKPLAYGIARNVPCPLVDSARLIYQVHEALANDVPAVYDRQIALARGADYADAADMNATAPAAGNYRVLLSAAGSYFRLGSTPDGQCTADVEGDASGSGYVQTTAEIILRLLARLQLTSAEINPTSFVRLKSLAPAATGFFQGTEPQSCAYWIDELLYGVGAFGGYSRHGAFSVGVVAVPSGTPEASYTSTDVLSLANEMLPATVQPVVWRVRVGWQRNYTVQTDLADGVSAARRTFAAEPIRYAVAEDAAIQSRHSLARELVVDSYFDSEADAQAEATRLLALWGRHQGGRGVFVARLPLSALVQDVGAVTRITHPRFGFGSGMPARVLGTAYRGGKIEHRLLV